MKKLLHVCTVFLLLFASQAYAQNRTITGTVTSREDSQTLPGVSVIIKGTTKGTQTGSDGKYTLTGVPPGSTLVFSFIGTTSVQTAVGTSNTVNAVLTSSSKQLTEVVVTSFGIQRQAASLGYATTKVSGKDITTAKPINPINGLTGKVSGLQINTVNNGLFAPTRIVLRGNRSLTGNNQALIVVDGSIYYSDISTINPEDIESTSILKGSSASALYGSDASNGVIIITTKRGTANKTPSITLSQTTQIEKVSYLPALQTQFGSNGSERFVDNFNDLSTYIPYENQSYGPAYNGKMVPLGRPFPDGSILMVPYSAVKNQKRDFFNTGVTTQNNFSYSSGDENSSFVMSFQDLNSTSIMPGDKGHRDVFRISGDKKYSIFSANYSLAYTRKTTDQTATGSVYNDLLESPTLAPLSALKDPNSKYGTPDAYFNDYYLSPGQVIQQVRNTSTEDHINGNLALSLKPTKWFNLTYRTSIDNTNIRAEFKNAGINFSNYTKNADTVLYTNANATALVPSTDAGTKYSAIDQLPTYGTINFSNLLFSSDLLANFNTKFLKDFNFSGTLGVAYLENKITYTPINPTALNFLPYNTSNFASTPNVNGQGSLEARRLGYLGQAQFSYKDFAFLNGSFRTDLDSRLSKSNRYIPYYDIDGAVVLSQAFKSIIQNDVLNFAKIRYAHSLTGNASPLAAGSQYIAYGAYRTVPTVGAASGFPYASSGISGYSLSTTIANPNIKPEKVLADEVGLDLGFLNDRITFGSSFYTSKTTDGIVYAGISTTSGFQQALLNAANTSNKGFELDLGGSIIKSGSVTWNVKANWSRNITKVNSIVSGVNSLSLSNSSSGNYLNNTSGNTNSYAVVGMAYPMIEGYDWNRDPATGKVIVDANTGLPTRASKLSILGQANPKDIVGLTSTVSYKNFTFSATADYRAGHKIFNSLGNALDHSGVGITTAASGRQRFVFPNSEYKDANGNYVNNTNVEVNDGNFNFWPTLYQSVDANYVISAAAWKLREAALSYAVPQRWLNTRVKFIKAASLGISGRNLLMIRPGTNKFTDPEFSEDTGNAIGRTSVNQQPPSRFYSATLSVTF